MVTKLAEPESLTASLPNRNIQCPAVTKAQRSVDPTKMLRVSVDISPQFNDRLSYLSDKLHISKAEVLKKAFVLLDAVVESTEDRSKKFGIANKDQTLETEFIGLW